MAIAVDNNHILVDNNAIKLDCCCTEYEETTFCGVTAMVPLTVYFSFSQSVEVWGDYCSPVRKITLTHTALGKAEQTELTGTLARYQASTAPLGTITPAMTCDGSSCGVTDSAFGVLFQCSAWGCSGGTPKAATATASGTTTGTGVAGCCRYNQTINTCGSDAICLAVSDWSFEEDCTDSAPCGVSPPASSNTCNQSLSVSVWV